MTFEQLWTTENIKEGFDRFTKEQGRLPTAHEVDALPYLPSARQIQRAFGGLKQLREALGYGNVDYGSGALRSAIASEGTTRGLKTEQNLEASLIARFGELYVHTEKRFGKQGNRVDFMVFTPEGHLGIDVFFPNSIRTLQNNLNIKVSKYLDFPGSVSLYFVCANPEISDKDIAFTASRMSKLKLVPGLSVVSLSEFDRIVQGYTRYADPPEYRSILS